MINFNEFSDAIIGMLNRREQNLNTFADASAVNFANSMPVPPASVLNGTFDTLPPNVTAEIVPIKIEAAKTEIIADELASAADKTTTAETKSAAIETNSTTVESEPPDVSVSFGYTPSQDTLRYLYSFMWNNDFLENFAPDTDYMQPVTEMVREELKCNGKFADSFRELEEKLREETLTANNELNRRRLEMKETMQREMRLKEQRQRV